MSEAVQGKELSFPENVRSAGEQLVKCQREEKFLKKRIEGLKTFLGSSMDAVPITATTKGSRFVEFQGVTRTGWYAGATKWASVMEDAEAQLSKKGWAVLELIKKKYTERGYREKYTMEEEE